MTFPADLAKLHVEDAGQPYLPSNGDEGEAFWSHWCNRCAKDKSMSEGKDVDDCEPHELCQILGDSFGGEVKEWVIGEDGQPKCTAFSPAGEPVAARCEHTQELF